MKFASCLLTAALALPAAGGARASVAEPATVVALSASVLRIEAPRELGGFAIGSAVVVAPERVVTNCHVTRDAREIQVVRGGARWLATAQAADVERDLCLLKVPGLVATPVRLGRTGELAIGQPVAALGYTGGVGLQTSRGRVIELHHHDGGRVIQSSNWFSSGASGGGLFDAGGALLGVLTFRLRGGDAHYFAAPVEWVRDLLDEQRHQPFADIAPLRSRPPAYWQQPTRTQPRFLRAAVLQRDAQWGELALLAHDWLQRDADDAEPWHLLGTALERLDRPSEARMALECSLHLAPAHGTVRAQLESLRGRIDEPAAAGGCRPDRH
ncbi:MAG: trypsin-like peptidase domain-containing protein [Piscinibacter sp.]|nr:trypsin-like peptidase domain-containing protein [Piscinibacter sp.]